MGAVESIRDEIAEVKAEIATLVAPYQQRLSRLEAALKALEGDAGDDPEAFTPSEDLPVGVSRNRYGRIAIIPAISYVLYVYGALRAGDIADKLALHKIEPGTPHVKGYVAHVLNQHKNLFQARVRGVFELTKAGRKQFEKDAGQDPRGLPPSAT